MSLRSITREAKRMLVFFDCDETTSVLGTNKVKTVLDGDKLVEGTSVLVDYGNAEYEAQVLQLHDDPSVLRQAETEFVSKRFHLHDKSDKENVPKPAKQQKMYPDKAKVVKPKAKGKAGKKAKAKKTITIEAEGPPSADNQPSGNTKPQSENKPGMLSFLNPQEQLKVQRLVAAYKKGDGKEVGVQTEQTVLEPHRLENVLKNLETKLDFHERKLNSILSLLTTVPANKPEEQEELFNCNNLFVVGNDSLEEECVQ